MKTMKKIENQHLPLVPATDTALDLNGPATWDTAKYWADMAGKFAHASVAAQVMAGFALLELRKKHGTRPGKRNDLVTSPNDSERLNWSDLVKQHAGITDDTAAKWMNMATAIRAKWKKLAPQARLKELMAVSPTQWNELDVKLVSDSLHKVADGQTQLDFMRGLGLAKLPAGAGATGGKGGKKKQLTLAEEAALRQELAAKDWHHLEECLTVYRDKFLVLPDDAITAQVAALEQALTARKAWLKQPLNARNTQAISDVFDA